MDKVQRLREQLGPWQAVQLDASRRGSGLNAVWKLRLPDGPAILKTFSARRTPWQTLLTHVGNRLGGRTSYTARGRQLTETTNLSLWRDAGLDVPHLLPPPPGLNLPLPLVCMEFLAGVTLASYLADETIPLPDRNAVLVRFLSAWAARHALADERQDPRLVQEHGSFEHVMWTGTRLVTFDLEVSFLPHRPLRPCLVDEICGYLRSLFRLLPDPLARHFFELVVQQYPRPDFLMEIPRRLLHNPDPFARLLHAFDRRWLRKPGKWNKYRIAELLQSRMPPARAV